MLSPFTFFRAVRILEWSISTPTISALGKRFCKAATSAPVAHPKLKTRLADGHSSFARSNIIGNLSGRVSFFGCSISGLPLYHESFQSIPAINLIAGFGGSFNNGSLTKHLSLHSASIQEAHLSPAIGRI